jgi:predicted TIM-barrel fold metal-dependent hydrolase
MGTDYPILDSSRYEKFFSESGIEKKTAEKILGENAANLLTRFKRA